MNKWSVLVGFTAMLAVCSGYPRRSGSGVGYALKQSRLRNGMSRRPAIRSKLSLPLKSNTKVRHHLSVKKLPVPDGHLNIIKQTVVLKSPKKTRGKSKQMPKISRTMVPLPQNQYNKMPAYNPKPTGRGRGPRKGGRGKAGKGTHGQVGKGGHGHAGPTNNQKNNMQGAHPALLPALNSLNQNLGGLLDAIRGTNVNNAPKHSPATNTQGNAPLPIIVMDNTGQFSHPQGAHGGGPYSNGAQNGGPYSHGAQSGGPYSHGAQGGGPYSQGTQSGGLYSHGAQSGGPYSNPLSQDTYGGHLGSLAAALSGLSGPLAGLPDLAYPVPSQGGTTFGGSQTAGHSSVGVSVPSHGSSSIGFSVPGSASARLGLSVPGHGGISVGVSGATKSGSGSPNSNKSKSSRHNTKNELLIMPNGPNTKAIRISTNGKFNYAKVKGQNNKGGIIFRSSNKSFSPLTNPTPSGEDPPEVGEVEQP